MGSATTAAIAKEQGYTLLALSLDYGQRHRFELEAAARVAGGDRAGRVCQGAAGAALVGGVGVGAVIALVHDVILTIGVFSELQIRFDLAIIAESARWGDSKREPSFTRDNGWIQAVNYIIDDFLRIFLYFH